MKELEVGDLVYVPAWDYYEAAIAKVRTLEKGVVTNVNDVYVRDKYKSVNYTPGSNIRPVTEEEIALFLLGGLLE